MTLSTTASALTARVALSSTQNKFRATQPRVARRVNIIARAEDGDNDDADDADES